MNLDTARKPRYMELPEQEKERRTKKGLYLYCGKEGHLARACLVRPQLRGTRPQGKLWKANEATIEEGTTGEKQEN